MAAKPYACHNREPYGQTVRMQSGWIDSPSGETRVPKMIEVPFRMNPACQFAYTELGKADKRCDGCKHKES